MERFLNKPQYDRSTSYFIQQKYMFIDIIISDDNDDERLHSRIIIYIQIPDVDPLPINHCQYKRSISRKSGKYSNVYSNTILSYRQRIVPYKR